ncbi:MAG: hypothetical protein KatS3mg101_1163 [Patescibacteria group bacterium]|nr:MAG: hypothetical protein KatS3mg101_1163 [Patescibacteria group bacterium]
MAAIPDPYYAIRLAQNKMMEGYRDNEKVKEIQKLTESMSTENQTKEQQLSITKTMSEQAIEKAKQNKWIWLGLALILAVVFYVIYKRRKNDSN